VLIDDRGLLSIKPFGGDFKPRWLGLLSAAGPEAP